ncbi:hypothetical protein MASR2M44_17270 [Bacteroidota bacterium]
MYASKDEYFTYGVSAFEVGLQIYQHVNPTGLVNSQAIQMPLAILAISLQESLPGKSEANTQILVTNFSST